MAGLIRGRGNGPQGISVGGSLEPIEPVYTKPNRDSYPLGTPYQPPYESAWNFKAAPIVNRAQDTRGMRYLYADQRQRQPTSPLGTGPDIGVAVWQTEFQPVQGSLRDYGFYDLLFRAGYPGFNLGLSFKVQELPTQTTGPGRATYMTGPKGSVVVNYVKAQANNIAPWRRRGQFQ